MTFFRMRLSLPVLLAAAFVATAFPSEETRGRVIVKAAKIHTCGPLGVLTDARLLIENGKIMAVNPADAPPSVPVMDFRGRHIMPGIVDAHSYVSGYHRLLENSRVITSDLVAYRAFNPWSPEVRRALREGITTVNFSPRNENLVGGVSSVFKLPADFEDMRLMRKEAFLKISFSADAVREERAPTSLMGAEVMLSERLEEARHNPQRTRRDVFPDRGIDRLHEGTLPPLVAASSYEEIGTALHWLRRWDLRGVILGGEDARHFIPELRRMDIPVLHSPLVLFLPRTLAENAAVLFREGVTVAFVTGMPEGDPFALRLSALLLHHQGVPVEEALKTITLYPARILGVDDSVGSIEEGKDADFVVLSGDPLDLGSRILAVVSDGRILYKEGGEQ